MENHGYLYEFQLSSTSSLTAGWNADWLYYINNKTKLFYEIFDILTKNVSRYKILDTSYNCIKIQDTIVSRYEIQLYLRYQPYIQAYSSDTAHI